MADALRRTAPHLLAVVAAVVLAAASCDRPPSWYGRAVEAPTP